VGIYRGNTRVGWGGVGGRVGFRIPSRDSYSLVVNLYIVSYRNYIFEYIIEYIIK